MSLRNAISLLPLFAIFLSPAAQANQCGWQNGKKFFGCDSFSEIEDSTQSEPRIGDLIAVNPAAIPTFPTPLGLEASYSNKTDSSSANQMQLSVLKGFHGLGFGFTSFDAGSFNGPDLFDEFTHSTYASEYEKYRSGMGAINGFRFGTGLQLPLGFLSNLIHLKGGVSFSNSGQSPMLSPNLGFLADIKLLAVGYSTGSEMLSARLPRLDTKTWTIGIPVGGLSLNATGSRISSSLAVQNVHVYALRWTGSSIAANLGHRLLRDDQGTQSQWIGSLDFRLRRNLIFGYIYGLYHDSQSLKLSWLFGGSSAGGPTSDSAPSASQ